jgi:hypothetical protein
MVENAQVKPLLTIAFYENWINFTFRYVVDYKFRRGTKDKIFSRILQESNYSPDKIQFANSSLEISQYTPFNVNLKSQ